MKFDIYELELIRVALLSRYHNVDRWGNESWVDDEHEDLFNKVIREIERFDSKDKEVGK